MAEICGHRVFVRGHTGTVQHMAAGPGGRATTGAACHRTADPLSCRG